MKEKLKELIEKWKQDLAQLVEYKNKYPQTYICGEPRIIQLKDCINEATNLLDKEDGEDGG